MSPNLCEFPSKRLYFSWISQTSQISLFRIIFLHKYPLIWHSFNQWPWSLWRTYCFLECGHILSNCTQVSENWRRNRTEKPLCIQVSYWDSASIILIWKSVIRTSYSAHGSMLNGRNKQLGFLKSKQCTCHILSTAITLPQNTSIFLVHKTLYAQYVTKTCKTCIILLLLQT